MEPTALFNRPAQVLFRIRRFFGNLKYVKARPAEVTSQVFQIPVRPCVSSYPDVASTETINQGRYDFFYPGRNEKERVSEQERCDNPSATYKIFSSIRGLFKRRPTPSSSGSSPNPSPNDVVIVDMDSQHTPEVSNNGRAMKQNEVNPIFRIKRVRRGSMSGDSSSSIPASQSTVDIAGVDASGNDDVLADDPPCSINAENEESVPEEEQNDDILYEYYSILYKSATIPDVPGGNRPKCVQMAAYWTIAILALLYGAILVKGRFLVPVTSASVVGISIRIAFYLSLLLLRGSWTFTSATREKDVNDLVKKSKEARHLFPKSHEKKKVYLSIGLILGAGVAYTSVSLIQSGLAWDEWTPEMAVELRAYKIARDAVVWTRNTGNATEAFLDSFTDDLNPISISLGLLSLFIAAVAFLHLQQILGACMIHSLSNKDKCDEFCEELLKPTAIVDGKISEKVWKMYLHLVEDSEAKNDIYGMVFTSYHSSNILRGAFFCYECTHYKAHRGNLFYLVFNVVRAAVFYIVNSKSSATNGIMRSWTTKNFGDKTLIEIENHGSITLTALLDDLRTQPIGIKINSILIGPALIAELVAAALTYFTVLLGTD